MAVGKDGDGAVVLGAGHPAVAVLARHQPALEVECVAVGIASRLAEHADGARGLVPAEESIVGDVAEQQVAAGGNVDRSLRPPALDVEAFDPAVALDVAEALVEDLELGGNEVDHRHFVPDAGGLLDFGQTRAEHQESLWELEFAFDYDLARMRGPLASTAGSPKRSC